jgi:TPR repeat protein
VIERLRCAFLLVFTRLTLSLLFTAVVSLSVAAPQPAKPSLRQRAAAGDAEAQFNLAKMYEAGRGGLKQDYVEAERWHRRAAEQGDPFAQASLGILLRFGKGIAQDDVEAYKWLYLATSQTSGGERESITELLDSTAARMTPKEIAEATRLAREWKPKSAQQH